MEIPHILKRSDFQHGIETYCTPAEIDIQKVKYGVNSTPTSTEWRYEHALPETLFDTLYKFMNILNTWMMLQAITSVFLRKHMIGVMENYYKHPTCRTCEPMRRLIFDKPFEIYEHCMDFNVHLSIATGLTKKEIPPLNKLWNAACTILREYCAVFYPHKKLTIPAAPFLGVNNGQTIDAQSNSDSPNHLHSQIRPGQDGFSVSIGTDGETLENIHFGCCKSYKPLFTGIEFQLYGHDIGLTKWFHSKNLEYILCDPESTVLFAATVLYLYNVEYNDLSPLYDPSENDDEHIDTIVTLLNERLLQFKDPNPERFTYVSYVQLMIQIDVHRKYFLPYEFMFKCASCILRLSTMDTLIQSELENYSMFEEFYTNWWDSEDSILKTN